MGVPASKVTDSLVEARDSLAYALSVLQRDSDDIYERGRQSIPEIITLISQIRDLTENKT